MSTSSLNRFLTALGVSAALCMPAAGQDVAAGSEVERLLGELAKPDQPGWEQIEAQIIREWSKSGSPAMDLLLERGEAALKQGDFGTAIEHFSALTDHAPGFAEGWNARASAFYHAGELGLSLADIERTLALNPNHFGALSGLAAIMDELGYTPQALEVYRALVAIHPHRPVVKEALERLEREVGGERL